jgi:DivIVA domain-containing protein
LTPQEVRNKKFGTTRLWPGYVEEEVGAFLDRVAAELEVLVTEHGALGHALAVARSGANPADVRIPAPPVRRMISADIKGAQFGTTRLRPGCDIQEVAGYLADIAGEISRLTAENNEFRQELFNELRITKIIADHDDLPGKRPDDRGQADKTNPEWRKWARVRHTQGLRAARNPAGPSGAAPARGPTAPPSAAQPAALPLAIPAPSARVPPEALPPGDVLPLQPGDPTQVGRYRLLGRLGAGGMGRVFLGASPGGRKVAVKILHPERANDPGFRARFAHEVAAASKVSGFYTAPVVDANPDANPPWLVTAYIPGPSLYNAITGRGRLGAAEVRMLGAALTEGLAAIHACGLIHRDLKPGNIVLADDGPRIIDFGLARSADIATLTTTGTLIGTFPFMSPEQIRGQAVGPESDVFSLGSVLAFALTGRCPFGATFPAVVHLILHEPPDLTGVSGELLKVIAWCLAKEPGDRPSTADLLAAFSGEGTRHPPRGTGQLPGSPGDGWTPSPLARWGREAPPAPGVAAGFRPADTIRPS